MKSVAALSALVLSVNAVLPWFATYDLTESQIQSLTNEGCYRGAYGSGDKRRLSVYTCAVDGVNPDALLPPLTEDVYMCVVELGLSSVDDAIDIVANTDNSVLLWAGEEEIIVAGEGDVLPEICHEETFAGLADNVLFVPQTPIKPQKPALPRREIFMDPLIERLVGEFNRQNVENKVRDLSTGFDGTNEKITRNSYSIQNGVGGCEDDTWNCARDVTQSLQSTINEIMADYPMEWSMEEDEFRSDMCPNIVVKIPGSLDRSVIVVTGAHLDSRNTNSGSSTSGVAPGADDNGTGSAVQLEMLEVIAKNNIFFNHSVHIQWFCGEEQGLIGSRALARGYRERGEDVRAMYNMDMIGYTHQNNVVMAFMRGSATESLSEACMDTAEVYVPQLETGYTNACCSDQQSYYQEGFAAAGIFETTTNSVVYPDYHRTTDTWDNGNINYDQVHLFGQALFSCILESVGASE